MENFEGFDICDVRILRLIEEQANAQTKQANTSLRYHREIQVCFSYLGYVANQIVKLMDGQNDDD